MRQASRHLAVFLAAGLPFAPTAFAEGAAKAADKAADKRAAAEALAKSMDALVPEKVEFKPKTTAKLKGKDGKNVEATLVDMDLAGVRYTAKDAADGFEPWLGVETASAAKEILNKGLDPKNAGHALFGARVMDNIKLGGSYTTAYLGDAAKLDKSVAGPAASEANHLLALADYNKHKPDWAWPRLAPESEAEALKALDDATQAAAQKAGLRFTKDQNEFFVFYTDADLRVAQEWARKLMLAYGMLCKTFDLDPRHNVWQGKCAVIVCRNKESYAKWMGAVAPGNAMAAKSAGLSIGNSVFAGSATIQFFHDPSNMDYCEKTLVHELCHAFTAQFHGNHRLASWANEGLAEYVCTRGAGIEQKTQAAREKIRKGGSLEDFFFAGNIQFDHYGAAFEITRLMLKKNPQGYARFVKAVTEGVDAEEALKSNCGLTFDQLAAGYARSLGMNGLKSH